MSTRVVAIDWSGKKSGARRTIWLAEARDGELIRLECGRSREEIADHLIAALSAGDRTVVGLDFAFSLPQWFMRDRGFATAHALWSHDTESWLTACDPPFWGRKGKRKPELDEHFRRSERETPDVSGIRPKSVFQIGGVGAVGTGSLRGMPVLRRLHDAGFSIWPFDPPGCPRVVEIYPRVFTGPVAKRDPAARAEHLATHFGDLPAHLHDIAASTEDAFDAAVSALVMSRHTPEFAGLHQATDPQLRLEGAIWSPACGTAGCTKA